MVKALDLPIHHETIKNPPKIVRINPYLPALGLKACTLAIPLWRRNKGLFVQPLFSISSVSREFVVGLFSYQVADCGPVIKHINNGVEKNESFDVAGFKAALSAIHSRFGRRTP